MQREKLEYALETLGTLAARCELYAADHTLSDSERVEQLIRAITYRDKQQVLLQTSECGISRKIAESLVNEMVLGGIGYDANGKWHKPEPSFSPNIIQNSPTADPYRSSIDLYEGWRGGRAASTMPSDQK